MDSTSLLGSTCGVFFWAITLVSAPTTSLPASLPPSPSICLSAGDFTEQETLSLSGSVHHSPWPLIISSGQR